MPGKRKLKVEQLEDRRMMAAIHGCPDPNANDNGVHRPAEAAAPSSRTKLETIGVAILNYESARGRIPAHAIYDGWDETAQPLLSWRVAILPYLGESERELYREFRRNEPWNSAHNLPLLDRMPDVFRSSDTPDDVCSPTKTTYQVVVGEGTAFAPTWRETSFGQMRDGLSNTVMVVSRSHEYAIPWTMPYDSSFDPDVPLASVFAPGDDSIDVVMMSGEVFEVPSSVSPETWTNMVLIDDGGFVDLNTFTDPYDPRETIARLGLASLNFESATRYLPPRAIVSSTGEPLLSWRVAILPYLEQRGLYDQFHLDEPWNSPHNLTLVQKMPRSYRHADVPIGHTNFLGFHGEDTVFPKPDERGRGITLFEIRDGASKTILFAEANVENAVEWTRPQDIVFDPAQPLIGVGGLPGGTFSVVYADGHVEVMDETIPPDVFYRAVIRNDTRVAGRQPLSLPDLSRNLFEPFDTLHPLRFDTKDHLAMSDVAFELASLPAAVIDTRHHHAEPAVIRSTASRADRVDGDRPRFWQMSFENEWDWN